MQKHMMFVSPGMTVFAVAYKVEDTSSIVLIEANDREDAIRILEMVTDNPEVLVVRRIQTAFNRIYVMREFEKQTGAEVQHMANHGLAE